MKAPKNMQLLGWLLCASLLVSLPSIIRIPRMTPFVHADVRAAAPKALDEMRKQGLWLVNVDMRRVERKNNEICFEWEHVYTARTYRSDPEILTTCTYE